MLNIRYQCGKPIAYIRGGELDGEILYIANEYDELIKTSENSDSYEDSDEGDGYVEHLRLHENGGGVFEPIPNPDGREVNYIAGKSGSGKSTYASFLISKYLNMNPDKPIYLFSMVDKDPAFSKYERKIIRIPIDDNLVDNPINLQKQVQNGAVIIFDDINPATITDKNLKKELDKLKISILEYGRKNNIDLIYTSHLINPNEQGFGRIIMNELHNLIIFKNGSSHHQQLYALTKHFGYSKADANKILKLNSRWILISNNNPEYILTERECIASKALKNIK